MSPRPAQRRARVVAVSAWPAAVHVAGQLHEPAERRGGAPPRPRCLLQS